MSFFFLPQRQRDQSQATSYTSNVLTFLCARKEQRLSSSSSFSFDAAGARDGDGGGDNARPCASLPACANTDTHVNEGASVMHLQRSLGRKVLPLSLSDSSPPKCLVRRALSFSLSLPRCSLTPGSLKRNRERNILITVIKLRSTKTVASQRSTIGKRK